MITHIRRWKLSRLQARIDREARLPWSLGQHGKLERLCTDRAITRFRLEPAQEVQACMRMRWVVWPVTGLSFLLAAIGSALHLLPPIIWGLPAVAMFCLGLNEVDLTLAGIERGQVVREKPALMLAFEEASAAAPERACYCFDVDDSGDAGLGEPPSYTDPFTAAAFKGWALHARSAASRDHCGAVSES